MSEFTFFNPDYMDDGSNIHNDHGFDYMDADVDVSSTDIIPYSGHEAGFGGEEYIDSGDWNSSGNADIILDYQDPLLHAQEFNCNSFNIGDEHFDNHGAHFAAHFPDEHFDNHGAHFEAYSPDEVYSSDDTFLINGMHFKMINGQLYYFHNGDYHVATDDVLRAAGLQHSVNPELVHVNGYYRSDGVYVAEHFRTAPDGIEENNLSYFK